MYKQYKETLLGNARYQCKKTGAKLRVRGQGIDRKVVLTAQDGRSCVVWYPTEARVHDLEIDDLKEAIKYITGHEVFSL